MSKTTTKKQDDLGDNRKTSFIYIIGDKAIEYNLRDIKEIRAINDFMGALSDYCKVSKNPRVVKLLKSNRKEIPVSAILRAVNGYELPFYFTTDGDFDLFHQVVTKYMFDSGWFIEFPALLLDTKGIPLLRLDIVKYILTNWEWLEAIYNWESFEKFAYEYGAISLKESAIEEDVLRRKYIEKFIRLKFYEWEKRMEENIDEFITNKERNPWFEENSINPDATIGFSTSEKSVEKELDDKDK